MHEFQKVSYLASYLPRPEVAWHSSHYWIGILSRFNSLEDSPHQQALSSLRSLVGYFHNNVFYLSWLILQSSTAAWLTLFQ